MIDYLIVPQHRLILIWGRNETSVHECIESIQKIHTDPNHSHDYDAIADVTDLTTNLSGQEMVEIIQFIKDHPAGNKPTKHAIVANNNRTYAQCRMFEQLSDGITPIKTAVFREWQPALKWLEKDPATIAEYLKAG
ncbi:hypothetical protein DSLASN_46290 [Desulfoluna limicola]|uniref:Uncharacterized protein n=1 Tax=Desulfoluna limicola TaxID=2810562 RepID=A0ABM7PND1_9BACT|nr:hypothetical protein [Desulfoluna limicola]BCS98997.1 hypothetical protein DSLASN_46290 [Desulfoluna limicola]